MGDLIALGLDENTNHMRITFDDEKSVSYSLCGGFIMSLFTVVFFPFYLILCPCIKYNFKQWAASRVAVVTDKMLVLKQGYYGCCCCCWNESTKSVPLDKITDMVIQQGCLQKYYEIKEIQVQTASATTDGSPEMTLLGLNDPLGIRSKILKVRDGVSAVSGNNYKSENPLLPANGQGVASTKELEQIVQSQHETIVEIKDVLKEMKNALVSMDNKMQNGDELQN